MPEIETSQSAKSASYSNLPDEASQLGAILIDVRSRRKPQDELWLLYHAAYRGRHMRAFFVSEIFKHYIPAARRAVERFVIRGAQMLVPSNEFFEVYPGDDAGQDSEAESVRSYLDYVFSKKIHTYQFVRQLIRTYALYGTCISKSGVKSMAQPVSTKGGGVKVVNQVWPMARVVDPFMFYVYPEVVTDVEDAQIMFEDVMMPYDVYDSFANDLKMGVMKIPKDDLTTPEWPTSHTRRLQFQNMASPESIAQPSNADDAEKVKANVEFVALTEVWRKKGGHWRQIWIVWNSKGGKPLIARKNAHPFVHSPYRKCSARDLPGEHYGTGMMDDLEPQQVLLNDEVNMTLEGQATLFSPPCIINPDLVSRPQSLVFRPRAKWLMDPAGAKWMEPVDTTRFGYQGIQFTLSLMDSFSGAGNPLVEGQTLRGMPRAGFSVSSLINLAMADLRDAAQMIEDQILSPLLGDLFYLAQEFVPPEQIITIPGAKGFPVNKFTIDELAGDWAFKWVGSLQSQDFQVRAQRLIAFMGQMAKLGPVIMGDLQMRGQTINWEYLLNRVWREGLGERGASKFVRPMTQQETQALQQQQQMQMMMMMAQASHKAGGGTGAAKPGAGAKTGAPGSQQESNESQSAKMGSSGAGGSTGG